MQKLFGYLVALVFFFSTSSWSLPCKVWLTHDGAPIALSDMDSNWENRILEFLSSKNPNYENVRSIMESLERLDTSRPQVQSELQQFTTEIHALAESLITKSPSSHLSEPKLHALTNKLRLLATPSLRNLLGDEVKQGRVGAVFWFYQRAIWDKSLDLAGKIKSISRSMKTLDLGKPSEIFSVTAQIPPSLQLEIVKTDLFNVKADAIISTIDCDGYCGSAIHYAIRDRLGEPLVGQMLKDGDTRVFHKKNAGDAAEKNFVMIVDDQKTPLNQIITSALKASEKAGFKSVVLPAFRTGYAFGAVEKSHSEIINEVVEGISKFSAESDGSLNRISFSVPYSESFLVRLEKELKGSQTLRERSVRHDLRAVKLSGRGFTLRPTTKVAVDVTRSPIYETLLKPWDLSHMMENHKPISIGTITDRAAFSKDVSSVLNMPIKMPGTDYRIPEELSQFSEFIQKMIDHEAQINPDVDSFYTYITVDHSAVKGGTTHRRGGIHIDGVQGARYPVKIVPEHTYSASDVLGTVFYDQPFDLRKLDPNTQHVHAELERQAKPENRIFTENYKIHFWDSYSPHEAAPADKDMMRTFIRVEFSKKIYDGLGDTHSPLFEYQWKAVPRPIPAGLDDHPI